MRKRGSGSRETTLEKSLSWIASFQVLGRNLIGQDLPKVLEGADNRQFL
jgi:hypothetical protein|nr:MAG TPA: hypothetical protein [Caudoviricetes sp.]